MSQHQEHYPEDPVPEKYYTVKEASELLGHPEWKLHRAINRGTIPHYKFMNSRKLVRLSEIDAFINASRQGGDDD